MKNLVCSVAFCVALGSAAQATTIRYDLVGSFVSTCTILYAEDAPQCGAYLGHSFDGKIEIDESKLSSGTLRNQSLGWYVERDGLDFISGGQDLAALDFQLQFDSPTYTSFRFDQPFYYFSFGLETDFERNPIRWSLEFLNDGPDYFFGNSIIPGTAFLEIEFPGAEYSKVVLFTGDPGTLQLAPIPLPATGLLLATALFGGVALHRRRRPA